MTQTISLARPVIYLKHKKKILNLIRNRCRECYCLLLNPTHCLKCKALQHKIFLKGTSFFEGKNKIYPIEIKWRLEQIQNYIHKNHKKHPKLKWINKLTLTRVKVSSNKKFREINKINDKLLQRIKSNKPESRIERLWNLLQIKLNKAV